MTKKSPKKVTKKIAVKKPAKTSPARKLAGEKHISIAAATAKVVAMPGGPISPPSRQLLHTELYPSELNPRKDLGDRAGLTALADSIVAEGILQSLLVREGKKHNTFEIICGARRHAAVGIAIKAGRLPKTFTLPCRVRNCTDAELVELAGTENMGRSDMHPLEEADVIAAMRKYHNDDAEIARRLGIPERTFYRRAALLRLAAEIRDAVKSGKVSLQQAAAFTLGKPADQVEHLKKMLASGNNYYTDVGVIRRQMTEKRIPVTRACFPIAQYDGEFIVDPDNGARYFGNAKRFDELQDKAIKLRIQGLKKEFSWTKEISEHDAYLYAKAKKGARNTGAVYFTKQDGSFQTVAPVLKPADGEKEKEADEKQATADREKKQADAEDLLNKVTTTVMKDDGIILALVVLHWVEENRYGLNGRELNLLGPVCAAALDCKGNDQLNSKLRDMDDADKAKIYRALTGLENEEVLDLLLKLYGPPLANMICGNGYELDPVGMVVMQIELPLIDKKAAA